MFVETTTQLAVILKCFLRNEEITVTVSSLEPARRAIGEEAPVYSSTENIRRSPELFRAFKSIPRHIIIRQIIIRPSAKRYVQEILSGEQYFFSSFVIFLLVLVLVLAAVQLETAGFSESMEMKNVGIRDHRFLLGRLRLFFSLIMFPRGNCGFV